MVFFSASVHTRLLLGVRALVGDRKDIFPRGGASSFLWASPCPAGPRAHRTAGAQLWSPAPDLVPAMVSWPGSSGQVPAEGKRWSRLAGLRCLDPSTPCWLRGWGPLLP